MDSLWNAMELIRQISPSSSKGFAFDLHFEVAFGDITDLNIIGIVADDFVVKVQMDRLPIVEQKVCERMMVKFHKETQISCVS